MLIPLVLIFFGTVSLLNGLGIIHVSDINVYLSLVAVFLGVDLLIEKKVKCEKCKGDCVCK